MTTEIYFYKFMYFKKENENYFQRTEHGRWVFSNKYLFEQSKYYGKAVKQKI